jgi:transposase-like protein
MSSLVPLVPLEELFQGRHFDQEIVILCVRWYLSFQSSSRDLVAIMREHGLLIAPTTILRWVQHYTPEFEKRWQRSARSEDLGDWMKRAGKFEASGRTGTVAKKLKA